MFEWNELKKVRWQAWAAYIILFVAGGLNSLDAVYHTGWHVPDAVFTILALMGVSIKPTTGK